jgi:hypothetical protein
MFYPFGGFATIITINSAGDKPFDENTYDFSIFFQSIGGYFP